MITAKATAKLMAKALKSRGISIGKITPVVIDSVLSPFFGRQTLPKTGNRKLLYVGSIAINFDELSASEFLAYTRPTFDNSGGEIACYAKPTSQLVAADTTHVFGGMSHGTPFQFVGYTIEYGPVESISPGPILQPPGGEEL